MGNEVSSDEVAIEASQQPNQPNQPRQAKEGYLTPDEIAILKWREEEEIKDDFKREEKHGYIKSKWDKNQNAMIEKRSRNRGRDAASNTTASASASSATAVSSLPPTTSNTEEEDQLVTEENPSSNIQENSEIKSSNEPNTTFLGLFGVSKASLPPNPKTKPKPPRSTKPKSYFFVDEITVHRAVKFKEVLQTGGIPITVYFNDKRISMMPYLTFYGFLRISKLDPDILECEISNGDKTFVLPFRFDEITGLGLGVGDAIVCDVLAHMETTSMFINIVDAKPQLTFTYDSIDLRDSAFLSLTILVSNVLKKPIVSLVGENVTVEIQSG
jgi:hypothetical protein